MEESSKINYKLKRYITFSQMVISDFVSLLKNITGDALVVDFLVYGQKTRTEPHIACNILSKQWSDFERVV
jgi:hypothetical protein